MKLLVSPAKSLNYESPLPHAHCSQPVFVNEAATLNTALRKKSPAELKSLMGVRMLRYVSLTKPFVFLFTLPSPPEGRKEASQLEI